MNKIDSMEIQYQRLVEARLAATRAVGPFKLAPSSKGKVYLEVNGKTVYQDLATSQIRELRDLCTMFITEVLGE